ncbi:DUF6268 family outer membrane beta-barrel protein [Winogradskyella bathintestinalis]|uniref:DUF6268 family outer membrane beta-barrel protein n=1 Tax=Winogradskyella bathintestinalis TaxID=3035208 RepID=A0ABT7ZWT7_9FLAO|nr:DUF6268 family outer membrane beta-barrel protein [Winogradskyella bathintestinalis]MDN3493475.1 DUF6268 family outer membrane beta-barrel protein [Winogradskyella bathintestinalis]
MIIDKIKSITTVSLLLMVLTLHAQSSDLFRIEYLNIPNKNSSNSINRFRTFLQLPLEFKKNNYIVVGGEYRYIDLGLDNVSFPTDDLKSVQRVEASLGYLYRSTGSWIYAAKLGARLQSNFETKLTSDDYIYVGNLYTIRDRTKNREDGGKPDRLIIGLEYTTTPGRNYPLPILNYYREFHPDWTYTLGVPKTNIRYKFNDVSHVQAFLTLDNFFANIQGNKEINGKIAENISMTTILGGLGYEHYITDHIMYYGYVAYTISNDYRLRDNEREDIYTIDDKGTFYFRTGIKFKI